jgi:hypothetical protein
MLCGLAYIASNSYGLTHRGTITLMALVVIDLSLMFVSGVNLMECVWQKYGSKPQQMAG